MIKIKDHHVSEQKVDVISKGSKYLIAAGYMSYHVQVMLESGNQVIVRFNSKEERDQAFDKALEHLNKYNKEIYD